MRAALRHRARIALRHIDSWLESQANRALPRSLTKRYVLGLGVVATIVCGTQLLEQASFSLQGRAFRQARLLDVQREESLVFSRAVQQLGVPARAGVAADRLSVVEAAFRALRTRQKEVVADRHLVYAGLGDQHSLDVYYDQGNRSLAEIGEKLASLRAASRAQATRAAVVDDLLLSEQFYRGTLADLSLFYERRIVSRSQIGRALGLASTVLVIALLAFTGLYVIRPAVRHLFEAVDTRSRFLGRMGNEIRNPLNSMLGMVRLLRETRLSDQQRHYVGVLQSSSNSLLGLLNNLIDYSRISSGRVMLEYCEIDLLNAVQDCIDLVTFKADRKGLDLLLAVDPGTSLQVTTDPLVLQQILLNLVENAVKFTPQGQVTVNVWQTRDFGRSRLHFSVTDTGAGLSSKKLAEVCEDFRQDDPSTLRPYGGSGLGLGICHELVKLTGGEIDVQSQKGKGSRFHFYLPVNRFSEKTFGSLFSGRRLTGRKVLLLEGNAQRREKLSGYLRASGGGVSLPPEPAPGSEAEWASWLAANPFDLYVLNHEHYGRLVPAFEEAERLSGRELLRKVIALLRSTMPSSHLLRLNSAGLKIFCYIPVKPVEFLAAVDLVLNPRAHEPYQRHTPDELAGFELSRPISALVADDSRDNQFLMKSYLEKHAGHMVVADNGEEALEKFKQNNFDIVFMDLLMPELDGYEAARQMRAWEAKMGRKGVPIVAVSAHTGPEEIEKCRVSGFTANLSKPLDLAELQGFIGRVFGEKVREPPGTPEPKRQEEKADVDENWKKKLKEYLPNYYKQRAEDLLKLRAAAEGSDWEKLVFIGHKIKGSAATYGFPELGQAGAELEQFAAEKDLGQVNSRIQYIQDWLKNVTT